MIFIIIIGVSLIMVGVTICNCAKLGEKEGISKYDNEE